MLILRFVKSFFVLPIVVGQISVRRSLRSTLHQVLTRIVRAETARNLHASTSTTFADFLSSLKEYEKLRTHRERHSIATQTALSDVRPLVPSFALTNSAAASFFPLGRIVDTP